MTENNAAQPVLTDAMILHRWDTHVGPISVGSPINDFDKIAFARAIESALLSKLRAPVADERVSDDTLWSWAEQIMGGKEAHHVGRDRVLRFARAALASAPVAGEATPVATLHDDGYYTWHGAKPEGYDRAGWRMKVYAAPQASEAVRDVEDAERWRWATASDGNADKLCSIVLCHGGYQDKINERADFYRAALSAQPGAQRTGGSDA